jgi:hypothetical protein
MANAACARIGAGALITHFDLIENNGAPSRTRTCGLLIRSRPSTVFPRFLQTSKYA